jgi:hypothetical protein
LPTERGSFVATPTLIPSRAECSDRTPYASNAGNRPARKRFRLSSAPPASMLPRANIGSSQSGLTIANDCTRRPTKTFRRRSTRSAMYSACPIRPRVSSISPLLQEAVAAS